MTLAINHRAGLYRYPIDVDPSVIDRAVGDNCTEALSNWQFYSTGSGIAETGTCGREGGRSRWIVCCRRIRGVLLSDPGGVTHLRLTLSESTGNSAKTIESKVFLDSSAGLESPVATLPAEGAGEATVCVKGTVVCELVTAGETSHDANAGCVEQYAAHSGSEGSFGSLFTAGAVEIVQEKGPSVALSPVGGSGWKNARSPDTEFLLAETTIRASGSRTQAGPRPTRQTGATIRIWCNAGERSARRASSKKVTSGIARKYCQMAKTRSK